MPQPPLIRPSRRPLAATVVLAAVALVAGLSVALHDTADTAFDTWVWQRLYVHIGDHASTALLGFSVPAISIVLLALVAVVALLARAWPVTVLAVVGPSVALGMTELVLKPLVHRGWNQDPVLSTQTVALAFPSGHETGLVSLLVVLALLVRRLPVSRGARRCLLLVLAVWAVLGAVGLVRGFYHYATDTIGGVGVAVACVVGVALVVDLATPALERRWSAARVRREPVGQFTWRS